ncbi:MAG: hypothetical protein OS112_10710 [Methanoregula sp.]|nr:MAG: hypothetical protein OS112_10710 [Methanoregula sp.]
MKRRKKYKRGLALSSSLDALTPPLEQHLDSLTVRITHILSGTPVMK